MKSNFNVDVDSASQGEHWPLSKKLFELILMDRISDRFVSKLVWERLGYELLEEEQSIWKASAATPENWSEAFLEAPEVIAERRASVFLTRSIPKQYKQLLKQQLNFDGYRIGELNPRRTRRATVINWLLAWLAQKSIFLPDNGPLPILGDVPTDPTKGHPGDSPVE